MTLRRCNKATQKWYAAVEGLSIIICLKIIYNFGSMLIPYHELTYYKYCILLQQTSYIMGRKILTVFPEPVWAHAMRSLPAVTIGMPYFCTGVGLSYFALRTFSDIFSYRSASPKLLMHLHGLLPSGKRIDRNH